MRRRRALVLIALAIGLPGCGGGPSAGEVLQQTTGKLRELRSADVSLRLVLEPAQGSRGGRVGFALRGPLALRPGGLPVARVAYTQIAGARQAQATFVSTGEEAFVETGGTAYRLSKGQTQSIASSAASAGPGTALPLGRWLRDPKIQDGGELDGTQTDRISASLDVPAALRDIFRGLAAGGAQVPDLEGAGADELRKAVTSSSVDVWSGREDRFVRRLRLAIGFQVAPPAALRQRLGDLVGGRLAFDLDLARINAPVRIEAPANPRPASALR